MHTLESHQISSGICVVSAIGETLLITNPEGEAIAAECLSGVPRLSPGDRVLVHLASTPAVIIGRLGGIPDELILEAGKSLTIRCGSGSLRIRADGRVLIEGLDVISRARRAQRITGAQVAIN